MTPTKRRATPATQGQARVAPDVPIVADPAAASSSETDDAAQLLGPEGAPLAQEDLAPPTPEPVASADRPSTQARRRPGGLYPLPVWPD
jgi:hypothetical protein